MTSTEDVRRLYLRLPLAWNDRDAAAMADCFADDGVMIGFDGSLVDGRARIVEHLTPIFADHPDRRVRHRDPLGARNRRGRRGRVRV